MSNQEEDFKQAKQQLQEAEEKKRLHQLHIEPSDLANMRISSIKEEFSRAKQGLEAVLGNVITELNHNKKLQSELEKMSGGVAVILTHIEQTENSLGDIHGLLTQLQATFTEITVLLKAEYEMRQIARDLEEETLSKLNKYLDNWM